MNFKNNNEFNNFTDSVEKCLYMLKLEQELLWKNVTILNDDLQIMFQGMVTESNIDENIKLIVNGCKYYIEEE